MIISSLPQELIDYCIDFLHADKTSLQSCTTTCHALLPSASYHLFYVISFSHIITVSPSDKLRHFGEALEGSPRLQSNVRELHLAPSLYVRRMRSRVHNARLCPIDITTLNDVLNKLDHLLVLDIRDSNIQVPQGAFALHPVPYKQLRNVVLGTLHNNSTSCSSGLWELLSLFAGATIRRLEVLGQWNGMPPTTSHASNSRLRVSFLVFHERSPEATYSCLEALRSKLDPQSLTALHVSLTSADSFEPLDSLIGEAGPMIRDLRLDLLGIRMYGNQGSCTSHLSFSKN